MGERSAKVNEGHGVELEPGTLKRVDEWRLGRLSRADAIKYLCEYYFNEGEKERRELELLRGRVKGLKWL